MSTRGILRTIGPLLLAAGLSVSTVGFAAQPLQVIKIQAGVLTKRVIGHTATGVPIEETTVSRLVHYGDLNLNTSAGRATLKKRVRAAAGDACKRLEALDPLQGKDTPECVHSALARAAHRVQDVIAYARKHTSAP